MTAMLADLIPVLRCSLERLERGSGESPGARLHLASSLRHHAGIVEAIAAELECGVHDELGRFGAQAVDRACCAADPEQAASEVADAFLSLCLREGDNSPPARSSP